MANSFDDLPPRTALAGIARDFHARGWMGGTAGNLSARADDAHFWITASGLPKGSLGEDDFLLVRVADGGVVERGRAGLAPSAETGIHAAIYALDPQARACLHGHTVVACLATARLKGRPKTLRLPGLEMVKAFEIWEQHPKAELALFENQPDVARIAREVRSRFSRRRPAISALLVRDHGPTVWGRGVQEAYNRFEALDFLLSFLASR
ncbi:methylthioribulose-1-phosphate dehydratase [Sulfurifustis variabilis]|uniref:Methylthioribulose-1-phosphate dehydratase n=1 Tax=Sulfurifustis variabilis TaxID=1675686 RepID=A0A1C7AG05_9GAMM|nr:methylthioribulose 1-phosphate dehydratase [Sulfurifustis variabilis]BAU50376.1 methylthioribulose-1-phosphate dehydratase [Sulfurifustis variabilis]